MYSVGPPDHARDALADAVVLVAECVAPVVYAVLSLGLFLFGIVTSGLGLLLALPWLAASSYAAWKDVFAVDTGGNAPRPPRSA